MPRVHSTNSPPPIHNDDVRALFRIRTEIARALANPSLAALDVSYEHQIRYIVEAHRRQHVDALSELEVKIEQDRLGREYCEKKNTPWQWGENKPR